MQIASWKGRKERKLLLLMFDMNKLSDSIKSGEEKQTKSGQSDENINYPKVMMSLQNFDHAPCIHKE